MDTFPADNPQTALAATLAPLDTEPRRAFDRLRDMGFRSVQFSAAQPGLRPRDLDGSARRDLAATLRRKDLRPGGVDAWIPPDHLLDPAHIDRAASALLDAIALAADLDRCPVSFTLPAADSDDRRARLAPVIATIVDRAEHLGVELADHAVPVAVREHVGIGIDPAAWLAVGADPAAAVAQWAGRLVSARLCDLSGTGMRCPSGRPNDTRLDLTAYRIHLGIAGYRHPLVVDARQWPDPWAGLAQSAEAWRNASGIDPAANRS